MARETADSVGFGTPIAFLVAADIAGAHVVDALGAGAYAADNIVTLREEKQTKTMKTICLLPRRISAASSTTSMPRMKTAHHQHEDRNERETRRPIPKTTTLMLT